MPLSLATADSALKEDYLPTIREQVNNTFNLLNQIDKNSDDIEGRRAVLSLHVSRNSGVGARAEGGTLPTAGNQSYAEERVPLRYNYGRIQLNGPVIRAMKSDKGSFTRAVESESKGVTNDLKRDVNRQIAGTSDGVIAGCGVTTASTTLVLAATTTLVQLRQFEVGMVIDAGPVATPTSAFSARTIQSINRAAKTMVISGAVVTTAATDFISRSGAGGATTSQKELTGLQTIVAASGTLHNVDPTVNPTWVSYVRATVGTISDNVFELAVDTIGIEGGEIPGYIITTDGVRRAYSNTLTSQKRFNDTNSLDLKGGFKSLSVSAGGGDIPLTWDRDIPTGFAFVLGLPHLKQHEMSDWEFMDEDGAILSRVSGVDAYEATLFKYHELCTDKRNAHGVMTGITEA